MAKNPKIAMPRKQASKQAETLPVKKAPAPKRQAPASPSKKSTAPKI
jgi:hypothetical protein